MVAVIWTSRRSTVMSKRVERAGAALAGDFEAADRFDGVAEEFDPHRLVPVGRKDVEDAAAERELAGQRDGAGIVKAAFGQPADEALATSTSSSTAMRRVWSSQARRARAPVAAGFECW